MILRGIDFGKVWDHSGVRGFFGEGQWFHPYFRLFGLTFHGSTFVAKTVTADENKGNMPLKADGVTPQYLFPGCVVVKPFQGVALNAVGLSCFGVKFYLDQDIWQKLMSPFFISFMPVKKTPLERMEEIRKFVAILKPRLRGFAAPVALQFNKSCPNVGLVPIPEDDFVNETWAQLGMLGDLGIPIVVKLSVTTRPQVAARVAKHDCCDALCVSNTVPWGKLEDHIDWKKLFSSDESPLARFGGGGLSGWPLFPLLCEWLREARKLGFPKPIAAGAGIQRKADVDDILQIGGENIQAINIGSVAMLRPWRVQGIISHAWRSLENRRYRSPAMFG